MAAVIKQYWVGNAGPFEMAITEDDGVTPLPYVTDGDPAYIPNDATPLRAFRGNQIHVEEAPNGDNDVPRNVDMVAAVANKVTGPASATDNAIARFDLATGKLIQNSQITIADGATGALSGTNTGDPTATIGANLSPTGTNNTTGLMMGLNKTLTPAATGRVLVIVSGQAATDTADAGFKIDLRYGTPTPPANGDALTGTQIGATLTGAATAGGAVLSVPFCHHGIVTGLTPATVYWFDVSLAAVTAGTATMTAVNISVIEL